MTKTLRWRSTRDAGVILPAVLLLGGCAAPRVTLAEALPQGGRATPWELVGSVWSGDLDAAEQAIGEQAAHWRPLQPRRVWLALYRHDQKPAARLSVCVFAFESPDAAHAAYESLRPGQAAPFNAGDAGCWTDDGVRFVWGRLVFDVFGNQPRGLARAEQAAYLAGFIEQRMPPDLPSEPR
ncbi:MAG: hypothetical protein LC135_15710 [Phycisphaerae bacterium]|nr:hypothetical protein [Phycisphaerae bacterium]MCZ2401288.1 hypothetical protein [Phycisphaerae bacterium]NUQ50420.1 hypothetical protein [Phycisphaerae bacterium]